MSKLRQAAQQALEALEWVWGGEPLTGKELDAIAALRQALAEPEQEPISLNNGRLTQYPDGSIGLGKPAEPEQEPVGQLQEEAYGRGQVMWFKKPADQSMLYTAAPNTRKPLTDEEIDDLSRSMIKGDRSVNWLCRAIERAHGIGKQT